MNQALPFTLDSIKEVTNTYPTPFHIYDERRIRFVSDRLSRTMNEAGVPGFRNYFAVKALPNPEIIKVLADIGMGVDCSSLAELAIAEMCGLSGEDIMFSSNNTLDEEFAYAAKLGAIINFDDVTLVRRYIQTIGAPAVASCRYNPGDLEFGGLNESIIGSPREAKYGMPLNDMIASYQALKEAGVTKFGIHTMLLSAELDWHHHEVIARALFAAVKQIAAEVGITFSFINLGGGIGVPYRPAEHEFDLEEFAGALATAYQDMDMASVGAPRVVMENGRYITADAGYLMTTAVDRRLPAIEMGDIVAIHTTGAHGQAMGFQYNGKLRHAELLLDPGGDVRMIRRAETLDDYFATLTEKGDYHVPAN